MHSVLPVVYFLSICSSRCVLISYTLALPLRENSLPFAIQQQERLEVSCSDVALFDLVMIGKEMSKLFEVTLLAKVLGEWELHNSVC